MLPSASKIFCFCSLCLSTLSDIFNSHSQLVNELQTGFQSVENKLSKEMGGKITALFGSTSQKFQKLIDDLFLNIDKPISHNRNIQMEIEKYI